MGMPAVKHILRKIFLKVLLWKMKWTNMLLGLVCCNFLLWFPITEWSTKPLCLLWIGKPHQYSNTKVSLISFTSLFLLKTNKQKPNTELTLILFWMGWESYVMCPWQQPTHLALALITKNKTWVPSLILVYYNSAWLWSSSVKHICKPCWGLGTLR